MQPYGFHVMPSCPRPGHLLTSLDFFGIQETNQLNLNGYEALLLLSEQQNTLWLILHYSVGIL